MTPPAALIFAISICAAASAGASNGAMLFVRSTAAPITIGGPVAWRPWRRWQRRPPEPRRTADERDRAIPARSPSFVVEIVRRRREPRRLLPRREHHSAAAGEQLANREHLQVDLRALANMPFWRSSRSRTAGPARPRPRRHGKVERVARTAVRPARRAEDVADVDAGERREPRDDLVERGRTRHCRVRTGVEEQMAASASIGLRRSGVRCGDSSSSSPASLIQLRARTGAQPLASRASMRDRAPASLREHRIEPVPASGGPCRRGGRPRPGHRPTASASIRSARSSAGPDAGGEGSARAGRRERGSTRCRWKSLAPVEHRHRPSELQLPDADPM